jgi:glycosyltransferase involved in cell wall biosynthesis
LIRLLLVNAEGADASAGGAETIVAMLAEGLLGRGWEVELLAAFPTAAAALAPGATLHRTSWRTSQRRRVLNHAGDLATVPSARLRRAVRAARPDIVHTHNLPGISTAIWGVAATTGARVVHTLHDYYLLCPRVTLLAPDGEPCGRGAFCTFRSHRLRRWSGAVDDVVAVSDALLARHTGFFPRAAEHVLRHPWRRPEHPVRPPAFPPQTIGYLGALEVTKGVHVLLDAAPRLLELGYRLRIAGSGRLRGAVETAAARLPGVEYAGRVEGEARTAFLAGCDVGVVPSVWDEPGGPPLTLLDWLGTGRPVLSSGRGGLAELEGAQGVVVVEPSADALVCALDGLRDEAAWAALGAAVRPPDLPSPEEWLDAYERVLRGEGARREPQPPRHFPPTVA